jgi:segregation and condensation protein A
MTEGQGTAEPFADPGPDPRSWEDPSGSREGRSRGAGAPILSVEGFEGPLDWLLEMVRAQKIDLARLSILALVTAFVTALERALAGRDHAAPLAKWGDWLVMAANLALLRSRLLLPADAAEARAAADEVDRLRRQLVGRAEIAGIVDRLDRRPQLGRDVFPRGLPEATVTGRIGDITELLRACLVTLQLPEGAEPYRPRPPPVWRVSDAITRITALLGRVPDDGCPLAVFLPLIDIAAPQADARCRTAVAATFLAGLELAREGHVALDQASPWTPIQLHRADRDGVRRATA